MSNNPEQDLSDDFYKEEKLKPLDNLAGTAIMRLVEWYLHREKIYELAEVARRTQLRRNEKARQDTKSQSRKRQSNEQPGVSNKKSGLIEGNSGIQEG